MPDMLQCRDAGSSTDCPKCAHSRPHRFHNPRNCVSPLPEKLCGHDGPPCMRVKEENAPKPEGPPNYRERAGCWNCRKTVSPAPFTRCAKHGQHVSPGGICDDHEAAFGPQAELSEIAG